MMIETCSGERHFYNHAFKSLTPQVFGEWDRKCDCKKHKLSLKEYKKWKKQFES